MKFHSKDILILMILCNIGALSGYYFLFQHIETEAKAASALTSTIDLGTQKNSQLSLLRMTIKDTADNRQKLSSLLLASDAEVPFIGQVESLAKNSGLSVKTNNISAVAGNTSATKIFKIQTETAGSWSDTLYFLSQVENLPYDIAVQGVTLDKSPVAGKSAGSAWTATFDISVTEST